MENKMDNQEIVESYLEDYFGHDLIETLSAEEIAEAVLVVNKLSTTINEFYGLNENEQPSVLAGVRGVVPSREQTILDYIRYHLSTHQMQTPRTSGPAKTK
tara:strand:- start:432 stop:734 length:303 start_codon:yes stop_codon:yes gene_type:complete